MSRYLVQYLLEPQGDTVAISDWKEHAKKIQVSDARIDIKQAIIEKLLKLVSSPFVVLDYWQI